jgi:SAM-dependent methyltransferase
MVRARRAPAPRGLVAVSVALACLASLGCLSQPPSGASRPASTAGSPVPTYGKARDAYHLLMRFSQGQSPASEPEGQETLVLPFPDETDLQAGTVRAYEENSFFTYLIIDLPLKVAPHREPGTEAVSLERRIVHLKPSLIVVDDMVRGLARPAPLDSSFRTSALALEVSDRRVQVNDGDTEAEMQILEPADAALQEETLEGLGKLVSERASPTTRLVHLFAFRKGSRKAESPVAEVERRGEVIALSIRDGVWVHELELPASPLEPGHIALRSTTSGEVLARRLLASGILPSGPEGIRLMERWDAAYRNGQTPEWETGRVCSALERVLAAGDLGSGGRVLELGCGAGMNAIALAERGFDVTAVDIAPTALTMAEERARQAGVSVRWILADVTRLPNLGTFDLLFDRGCYHNVREIGLAAFLDGVSRSSHPGSEFLLMAGNANERPAYGPPRVSEADLRREFEPLFEFVWIRDSRFDPSKPGAPAPLAWLALMRRKAGS